MPNWTFNKLHLYGEPERLKEVREFMKSEESEFDFNKLIPMPPELNLEEGSDTDLSIKVAKIRKNNGKDWKKSVDFRRLTQEMKDCIWFFNKHTFDEWADIGDKYLNNILKYNYPTWYEWCTANWGTKWNACDIVWSGDDFVSFSTAWSEPEPVFRKLSETFPDIGFTVDYADEDLNGVNGTIDYEGGHYMVNYENSFDFACDVWGYDVEEMKEEYGVEV